MPITAPSAGILDQRVQLQQRAAGLSVALGEPTGAWVNVGTPVWASVEPLRGREYFAAAQQQQVLDVRVRILYRADVAGTWRLLWRGQPYDIVGEPIDVGGAGRWTELMCVKGVRDGR